MRSGSLPKHAWPKKHSTGLILGLSLGIGVLLLALRVMLWAAVLAESFSAFPWDFSNPLSQEVAPPSSQEQTLDLSPGCAMERGAYALNCREYLDRFEILLSRLEDRETTLKQDTGRNYRLYLDGEETKILLRFYQNNNQVDGIENFQIVEVYSGENTPMSSLACHACAVNLYLADSTMENLSSAITHIQNWNEDCERWIDTQPSFTASDTTSKNLYLEISYISGNHFQSMRIEDPTASGY